MFKYLVLDKGFTLLSALAAVAISSLVLSSLLVMVRTNSMTQRRNNSNSSLETSLRLVEALTANPDACQEYLSGKQFDPTPSTLTLQMVSGIVIHKPGIPSDVIIQGGTKLSTDLEVTDISLKDFVKNGTNRYLASINFGLLFSDGFQPKERRVVVQLVTQSMGPTTERVIGCTQLNAGNRFSGKTTVAFFNGTATSTIASVNFPMTCSDPVIVAQTMSGSIACGNSVGPTTCANHPSTSSTDLHAYVGTVTTSSFQLYLSTASSVWVGSSSPAFSIAYQVSCL